MREIHAVVPPPETPEEIYAEYAQRILAQAADAATVARLMADKK